MLHEKQQFNANQTQLLVLIFEDILSILIISISYRTTLSHQMCWHEYCMTLIEPYRLATHRDG